MNIKYDLGIATRLRTFRKKYISSSSITASKELGIAQTTLTRMETGAYPITEKIIRALMNKFDLNRDWLLDNLGDETKVKQKVKPTPLLLSELMDKIHSLTTEVIILNKNQSQLWKLVEKQQIAIEFLEKKYQDSL